MSIYTILDIETTGFSRESDNILEVGYLQVDKSLNFLRSGSLYFYKQDFKVETPAQRVHKLSRSFLEKYENDFEDNLVSLFTLMYKGIILGKNSNAFDIPFIQSFIRRYAYSLYPVEPYGVLDLQNYYKPKFQKWYAEKYKCATNKSGSLLELVEMIGYSQEKVREMFMQKLGTTDRASAHSALYDVFMTYLLVEYAVENYGMKL